ncbi:MAG: hybrid sensor histidine kinase/response regulator [bacterium]
MNEPDRNESPVPATEYQTVAMGVAHDVNELLGVILGRAQLLLTDSDDPAIRRHLVLLETAAHDAAQILRRLLSASSSSPAGSAGPVALASVVADSLELTRRRWDDTTRSDGARYRIEQTVPADLYVGGSPSLIREVVTNLIINGLEAMPDGGELHFTGSGDREQIRLEVRDNGCGMTAETVAKLFTPGFTTNKPAGHGLGLATCHRLVQQLGGEIEVVSEPAVGSSLTLVLPAASTDNAPLETRPQPDAMPAGTTVPQRILVVDNEPQVRELMTDVLTPAGHQVTQESDGREVLSRFVTNRFDIVVVDHVMPGLSGMELAGVLRERDPVVAIILISGWGSEAVKITADPQVIDGVATKPLDVQEILELVASAARIVADRRRGAAAAGG